MAEKSRFTSDRRVPSTSSWRDDTDWAAGVAEDVDVVDGGLIGRPPNQYSELPDSVVSQYDATQEGSTTSITTITDQLGFADLTGNATVVSGVINGNQVYRFDGTDGLMSHASTYATTDPFAVIFVTLNQSEADSNFYFDGGSVNEFRVQDTDTADEVQPARGGTGTRVSTPVGTDPHLWVVEGYNSGDVRINKDGTDIVDETLADSDLTGLTIAAAGDGSFNKAVDFGQIEVTQGHTQSDLDSIKSRLSDKWGIAI